MDLGQTWMNITPTKTCAYRGLKFYWAECEILKIFQAIVEAMLKKRTFVEYSSALIVYFIRFQSLTLTGLCRSSPTCIPLIFSYNEHFCYQTEP